MKIRWCASCLVLCCTGIIVAQERREPEALPTSSETQFDRLDDDNNGQLDAEELKDLSAAQLESLRAHGLPETSTVTRDAFVAASSPSVKGDATTSDLKRPDALQPGVPATGNTRISARKGRFVPELPAEYSARDKNGDGQIALYEWDRKKYSEFAKLDKNGDGFLTPAELLPKEVLKTLYSKTPKGSGPAVPGSPAGATAPEGDAIDKEARGAFSQLDEKKDGAIDETDWARSRRTRGTFESAGITVSLPMNVDTFVALYRRSKESEKKDSGGR